MEESNSSAGREAFHHHAGRSDDVCLRRSGVKWDERCMTRVSRGLPYLKGSVQPLDYRLKKAGRARALQCRCCQIRREANMYQSLG